MNETMYSYELLYRFFRRYSKLDLPRSELCNFIRDKSRKRFGHGIYQFSWMNLYALKNKPIWK